MEAETFPCLVGSGSGLHPGSGTAAEAVGCGRDYVRAHPGVSHRSAFATLRVDRPELFKGQSGQTPRVLLASSSAAEERSTR
jgi:hypothetical protein